MLCNTSKRETPGLVTLGGAAGTGASDLALRLKLFLRPNESLRASDDTVPTDTAAAAAAAAAEADCSGIDVALVTLCGVAREAKTSALLQVLPAGDLFSFSSPEGTKSLWDDYLARVAQAQRGKLNPTPTPNPNP